MDALEELLQMGLDHIWILGLSQYLQQIVVTDEVEAWHRRPLGFEELGQCLLATLQLIQHSAEVVR